MPCQLGVGVKCAGELLSRGLNMSLQAHPSHILVSPDFTIEKFKTAMRTVPEASMAVVSADASLMEDYEDEEEVEDEQDLQAVHSPRSSNQHTHIHTHTYTHAHTPAHPPTHARTHAAKKLGGDVQRTFMSVASISMGIWWVYPVLFCLRRWKT